MTDAQKYIDWLDTHGCSERELWLLQNMLGTVYGFESDVAQAAKQRWERARLELFRKKKPFLCAIGLHKKVVTGMSGINTEAYCSRCGFRGLLDSQGNLF